MELTRGAELVQEKERFRLGHSHQSGPCSQGSKTLSTNRKSEQCHESKIEGLPMQTCREEAESWVTPWLWPETIDKLIVIQWNNCIENQKLQQNYNHKHNLKIKANMKWKSTHRAVKEVANTTIRTEKSTCRTLRLGIHRAKLQNPWENRRKEDCSQS